MNRTVVINVVGLTKDLIGENTPSLSHFMKTGEFHFLSSIFPLVTCSVQASFTTGLMPRDHGCVANGWYFRNLSEIFFWKQSNKLVCGEKIWEAAKKIGQDFTCANLFWWYNMYSSVDFSVTPRPMYPADGRKIPDIYTEPASLRQELNHALGQFPLFHFWGPKADIISSEWIAQASQTVFEKYHPSLTLIYLPHLDYNLQRLGPQDLRIQEDLRKIDSICGKLINFFQEQNTRIILLSEYGIAPVCKAIHINRLLREEKYIRTREELGLEILDPGASEAFAVADHQIAHVYVKNPNRVQEVRKLLEKCPGIEAILGEKEQAEYGVNHPNSGELIAIAEKDAWFTYYYWLEDRKAPDFARTVDIHRKPGYDPVELFLNPQISFPIMKIAWKLILKKMGFRTLLDVISLDSGLVKGSHGRYPLSPSCGPVFMTNTKGLIPEETVHATDVKRYILQHIFDKI